MPDPTPSAAHVAAAEKIFEPWLYAGMEESHYNEEIATAAAILARHFPSPPPVQEFAALAAAAANDIREGGWSVAVHNDYWLGAERWTFWLFTKDNRCVKGEGRTDAEALNIVRVELAALRAADATAGEQTPAPPSPAAPADPGSAPTAR